MPSPVTFNPGSSPLSSALTDPTDYYNLKSDAIKRLEIYQPVDAKDISVKILSAFVNHLPRDGAQNICEDILDCGSNEELRMLASHVTSAVLVPSKLIHLTILYYDGICRSLKKFSPHSESKGQDSRGFAISMLWRRI